MKEPFAVASIVGGSWKRYWINESISNTLTIWCDKAKKINRKISLKINFPTAQKKGKKIWRKNTRHGGKWEKKCSCARRNRNT